MPLRIELVAIYERDAHRFTLPAGAAKPEGSAYLGVGRGIAGRHWPITVDQKTAARIARRYS